MKKPSKISLKSLPQSLPSRIDVFICCASFEERCRSIPNNVDLSSLSRAIVCFDDSTSVLASHENANYLRKLFGQRTIDVGIRINQPLVTADSIQAGFIAASDLRAGQNYVVDITTFTHEDLLILLKILQARLTPQDQLTFVYNSAIEYSVGSPSEEKWLTKGIGEVRSVLGYPGTILPTRKLHLLVLAGFETERADRLIESYEPALISIGYGDPLESITAEHYATNREFQHRLVEKYKVVEEFTFSCSDPLATREAVLQQVNKFPGYNALVAPLNTKISTVGAALAAFEQDAIQICYATAQQYNTEAYSIPSDECYVFQIPLLMSVVAV